MSVFNMHAIEITHSFIMWFFLYVCRPRSCHWNSCWSSTKKRSCDQRGATSLFSSTKSIRNSNNNPVLHKQKQSACCGFFRWLPVTMEYENFEKGVSRLVCLREGSKSSILDLRKYVKLKTLFSGTEILWNNLGMLRKSLLNYEFIHGISWSPSPQWPMFVLLIVPLDWGIVESILVWVMLGH